MSETWRYYDVSLKVLNRIFGGLPKNPELIQGFLKGKGVPEDDESKRLAAAIKDEVGTNEDELAEAEERMWTTFKSDKIGPYIETRQIKAMLKEAVGEMEMYKRPGLAGLKSRIGGAVFPKGEGGEDQTRIYFYRPDGAGISAVGQRVEAVDGYEESVGHVRGPQGPRSILKRKDYIESPSIHFVLKVGNKRITEEVLTELLEFGQELGIGADRSMEHGKFLVLKMTRLTVDEAQELGH